MSLNATQHYVMNRLLLLPLFFFSLNASAQDLLNGPKGLVPDERTAVAIAEAILIPIYGEKAVHDQRPYEVKLVDKRWIVTGSLRGGGSPTSTVEGKFITSVVGGTFHITISQKDARIIDIGHGA